MHLGQKVPCTKLAHTFYLDALHASVCNLIFKQSGRYTQSSNHIDVEDMAQECWIRVQNKLHTYKASRSKFTTWVMRVSCSVLNKQWRRGKRYSSRFVETQDGVDEERISADNTPNLALRADFADIISQLKERDPKNAHIVDAIFMDEDGDLNHKIVYKRAAERSGVSAPRVSKYYREVVQPFFIEKFKGDR